MIRIAHLLDDFAMGGVTRALSLFDDPRLTALAQSRVIAIGKSPKDACYLDAELIVLHVPPCWSRLPFLAALRVKNPKARIVQVEHSYTRAFECERVGSRLRFRSMLRIASRLVDEVIAVSRNQADWLREVGIDAAKLRTINPWCGREELFSVQPLRAQGGPVQLLCYGRFSPEKNVAALIEAVGRFNPGRVALTVIGSGPEQDRLETAARRCTNVRVLGATSDPMPWLEHCDAVVIPSIYEAFGLVATEARMAGRPILVAEVDGLSDQAAGGAGLALPMREPIQIEAGIHDLLRRDLGAMGTAGRLSVAPQHDEIISGWRGVIRRAAEPLGEEAGTNPATVASA
ncbi:glycosyltransferase family 4 protein [Qipengyuania flava]|uniref:glycosyltransferase family 4 protein n=1 Tax=Qipengyuania flava TaxID=192812 RepID=UPI001C62FE3C|nr:glycosyltransferase family 4 protein [Qipengyuania flava]QYJ06867.1 glycosyltransferase family 4 protein [Qipengyuania flava]